MHQLSVEQIYRVSAQGRNWLTALLLLCAGSVVSCGSSPQTSSSSHWLTCVNDADCDNLPVSASCSGSGRTAGYCVDEGGEPIELVPTFETNFGETALDARLFRYETGADLRNDELQTYTESAENVQVVDGELVLVATVSPETGEYSSGSVELLAPLAFGRIEASVKADVGSGARPSIWLLPAEPGPSETTCVDGETCTSSTWPVWGGIVLMSGRADGSAIVGASYATDDGEVLNLRESVVSTSVGPTMSSEYHLYALEWGRSRIDWFIDGELVHSFEFGAGGVYEPGGESPFHQSFRIKMSLAVGGLVEAPTAADYPKELRVRSLRVEEFK